jgi:hypothetical protein
MNKTLLLIMLSLFFSLDYHFTNLTLNNIIDTLMTSISYKLLFTILILTLHLYKFTFVLKMSL